MTRLVLLLLTFFLGVFTTNAQQITGQIIDSQTKEAIGFVTIKFGETDLISNEKGFFTISSENDTDIISISYIGYQSQKITVGYLKQNKIIELIQGAYDIGGIYVSNVKPNPNEIMKLVNEKLSENYGDFDYKYKVFIRQSSVFKPKTLDVNIKKSTGYSKNELKKANENITKFTKNLITNPVKEYTDVLLDYHLSTKEFEGKKIRYAKAEAIKGVKMKDQNRSTSIDDIEKSALNLLTQHLDTTKFYRIKSGLIGSRDTISFSEKYNKQQEEKRRIKHNHKVPEHKNLTNAKGRLASVFSRSNPKNNELSFINKPEIYKYSFVESTYIDEQMVYVLDFQPKKSKAKHTGKIYISEDDLAVVRVDYDLAEGKKMGGINLKLLLGVKIFENVHKGTIIYKKNPNSKKYYPHYFAQEDGQYFYINRPLKLIEINKKRKERELLSFDVKVEGNTSEKTEYLNMEVKSVNKEILDAITEKDFEYEIHNAYNPNTWKGYNVIEPIEEMKKFKSVE